VSYIHGEAETAIASSETKMNANLTKQAMKNMMMMNKKKALHNYAMSSRKWMKHVYLFKHFVTEIMRCLRKN
jgi:hypothetical protein